MVDKERGDAHGTEACEGGADCEACEAHFCDGRVDDAVFAELVEEALRDLRDKHVLGSISHRRATTSLSASRRGRGCDRVMTLSRVEWFAELAVRNPANGTERERATNLVGTVVPGDLLAEDEDGLVPQHLLLHRGVEGLSHRHLAMCGPQDPGGRS